ncbi:hypothetical protein MF672_016215 [Actinomadura sp. ATCC 31491]|uniref:Uncharacterized protein n=1 Tax=Actinomadura luzonensis TaxID=2805427 RepID=A0ABT0FSL8_9ACTN|nr:hypothetical protein [Actinomadura luzonensis]MCK2215320.1 hypothetical protein [Actinomadura luzonensis]
MTERARDIFWTFGCGLSVVIAVGCATFGTFLDLHLVARAQLYCQGDLSSGERFAGVWWSLSRVVIFPIVSVLSALAAQALHLPARLPWPAAVVVALVGRSGGGQALGWRG